MKIIFIPGIKTPKWYLRSWKKDLQKNFPQAEIIFLDNFFYWWWQIPKLEKIIQQGTKNLQKEKPIILIAHSFGGILAKSIIRQDRKKQIIALITMASPHNFNFLGIKRTKKLIKSPDFVTIPTFTFGGYLDFIVPFPTTKTKNSHHHNFWTMHLGWIFSAKKRAIITKLIKEIFEKKLN